ncbi:MAG: hypothetical protein DMG67_06915 [Acidobacteria bacterium]|nr:MAG: hypothetical protein DMG67_06915 [Acidobacteriota bacterium]
MAYVRGCLLAAVVLYALWLPAQKKPSDQPAPAQQQVTVGVSVDAARKTSDLPTSITTDNNTGVESGGYEIRQSAEFGGRIADFSGSHAMWDTLINLGSGPRLLEYTLDMHAPKHTGILFDDLSFSNFGYGGDPDDVTRFRMLKGTLYNLNASFRRNKNIFDYDLLANPLNPSTSNPNIPILDSPHEFLDVNLNLFTLAPVRLRFGWSRVVNEGRTFSTTHQGTEGLLLQPTRQSTDSYHAGFSLRFIPRTSINYDQFYTFFKNDTSAQLNSLPFVLAGGIPVDLGLPFNTVAGQPCATPILGTGFVNPACNGYFRYNRFEPVRNSYPTEQISLQSNYFKKLDVSGRFDYSDTTARVPAFNEVFNGLITRTRQRNFQTNGVNIGVHRVSATADLGLTFWITDQLRLVDDFRFNNFRIPGSWNLMTNSLFGATLLSTPNTFSLATCPPPFTAATCPQHNTSSSADVVQDTWNDFLRQNEKVNTFEVEYDFTRRISAHVGYRYENREITHNISDIQIQSFFPTLPNRGVCVGLPVVNGVCTATVIVGDNNTVPIHAHSALAGFAARPTDAFRISFDTEIFYADKTFTRITPRHLQQYKLRSTYQPKDWLNFGLSVNIRENRNDTADIGNLQHDRSYAFTTTIAPVNATWGLDLSYDYNDIFSQTNICFVATPSPPTALSCGAPFLSGISTYKDRSHYGAGSIYFRPINRLTTAVGYTVTSTAGSTLILNPNAPTGPLSFNYHLPTASLAWEFTKHFTYKTNWNYYGYHEKSDPGPTLPRNFRGNVFTLSLRYSM